MFARETASHKVLGGNQESQPFQMFTGDGCMYIFVFLTGQPLNLNSSLVYLTACSTHFPFLVTVLPHSITHIYKKLKGFAIPQNTSAISQRQILIMPRGYQVTRVIKACAHRWIQIISMTTHIFPDFNTWHLPTSFFSNIACKEHLIPTSLCTLCFCWDARANQ